MARIENPLIVSGGSGGGYGEYNAESILLEDGTQELRITPADKKPASGLQWKCDNMKSLRREFSKYNGTAIPKEVLDLDTSKVEDISYLFDGCKNLLSLNLSSFNTENVKDFSGMFYNCNAIKELDLSNFNTKNATIFYSMFSICVELTKINLKNFNTLNCENFTDMFAACSGIETLDLSSFNTHKGKRFERMFRSCAKLKTVVGKIDLYSSSFNSDILEYSRALIDITFANIRTNLSMKDCNLLSENTIINTAKELWDLTGSTIQNLTLHPDVKAKLSDIYVKPTTPDPSDPYANNKKPVEKCNKEDVGAINLSEYIVGKNWNIA